MVTSLVTKAQLHAGLEQWREVAAAAERANMLADKGGMRVLVKAMAQLLLVEAYFREGRWSETLVVLAKAGPAIRLALLGDASTRALDFYEAACHYELGHDRPAQLAKARAALAELRTADVYQKQPAALEPFEAWLAKQR